MTNHRAHLAISQSRLLRILQLGTLTEKRFLQNGIDPEKCVNGFVMSCKLTHLEYFQRKIQGYNPFDLTNHGSGDMMSRTGLPINLQILTPVKVRNSIWNRV